MKESGRNIRRFDIQLVDGAYDQERRKWMSATIGCHWAMAARIAAAPPALILYRRAFRRVRPSCYPISESRVTLFRFKDSWLDSPVHIGKGLIQKIGKLKSMQRKDKTRRKYPYEYQRH